MSNPRLAKAWKQPGQVAGNSARADSTEFVPVGGTMRYFICGLTEGATKL